MTRGGAASLLIYAALCLFACTESVGSSTAADGASPTTPSPAAPTASNSGGLSLEQRRATLTEQEVVPFARRLAPMLTGRVISAEELATLRATKGPGLQTVLKGWVQENGFGDMARDWISTRFHASGTSGTVNLNLPGNLARHLVKENRPWTELITADTCIDDSGKKIACDTGAPFTSGILTTRALLANTAGRFNLRRARTLMVELACKDYPLTDALQPRLNREVLIPLFQVDKAADGTNGAFGNGVACYSCHSQFGAHAQVFVKFDAKGQWQKDATGIQLEGGEQGKSANELFASHLQNPADAAKESSQYFGQPVQDLKGAGEVMAKHPLYLRCTTQKLLSWALGVSDEAASKLPDASWQEILSEATSQAPSPTLQALTVAIFSHPDVLRAAQVK